MSKHNIHIEVLHEESDNREVMEDNRKLVAEELPRVRPVSVADIEDPAERFVCESCQ